MKDFQGVRIEYITEFLDSLFSIIHEQGFKDSFIVLASFTTGIIVAALFAAPAGWHLYKEMSQKLMKNWNSCCENSYLVIWDSRSEDLAIVKAMVFESD